MRTTEETPCLSFCEEAKKTFWRSTGYPYATGLDVSIAVTAEGEAVIRVSTGGYLTARYIPSEIGCNSPIQVQGTFTVNNGVVETFNLSSRYEFGDTTTPIPVEVKVVIEAEALELIRGVIETCPSFPSQWDAAVTAARAERTKSAAKSDDRARADLAVRLGSAVGPVLFAAAEANGQMVPLAKDLSSHEGIQALIDLIAPPELPVLDAPSGDDITAQVTAATAAAGRARIDTNDRVSEAEVIALVVAAFAEDPDIAPAMARKVAQATYDVMHDANYNGGSFPDRSFRDDLGLSRHPRIS